MPQSLRNSRRREQGQERYTPLSRRAWPASIVHAEMVVGSRIDSTFASLPPTECTASERSYCKIYFANIVVLSSLARCEMYRKLNLIDEEFCSKMFKEKELGDLYKAACRY